MLTNIKAWIISVLSKKVEPITVTDAEVLEYNAAFLQKYAMNCSEVSGMTVGMASKFKSINAFNTITTLLMQWICVSSLLPSIDMTKLSKEDQLKLELWLTLANQTNKNLYATKDEFILANSAPSDKGMMN